MRIVALCLATVVASCSSSTCSAGNCPGCCDSTGTCQSGSTDAVCGTGGVSCVACRTGDHCGLLGTCVDLCNASNCAGCCTAADTCESGGANTACGPAGGACVDCTATAKTCSASKQCQ